MPDKPSHAGVKVSADLVAVEECLRPLAEHGLKDKVEEFVHNCPANPPEAAMYMDAFAQALIRRESLQVLQQVSPRWWQEHGKEAILVARATAEASSAGAARRISTPGVPWVTVGTIYAVKDWQRSPLVKINPQRRMLVGRDLAERWGALFKLDFKERKTTVISDHVWLRRESYQKSQDGAGSYPKVSVYVRIPSAGFFKKADAFLNPGSDISQISSEFLRELEFFSRMKPATETCTIGGAEVELLQLEARFVGASEEDRSQAYRISVQSISVSEPVWPPITVQMMLGRDFLDNFALTLDGRSQAVTLKGYR